MTKIKGLSEVEHIPLRTIKDRAEKRELLYFKLAVFAAFFVFGWIVGEIIWH